VALLPLSCGNDRIDLFPIEPAEAAAGDAVSALEPEAAAGVSCASDADCKNATEHRCEVARGVCVDCVGDSDCAGRNDSRCNLYQNRCVLPCTVSSNCLGADVCDTSHMWCADCVMNDAQCGKSKPHCVEETCVCQSDAECGVNQRCWVGTCVSCVTSADCPAGQTCTASHDCG